MTGDNNNRGAAITAEGGEGTRPFIRLLPIEIPQPTYFDESSASEEDYDYEDGGEYSDEYSDHTHSRHNSSHLRHRNQHVHPHHSNDFSDDDDDLVEHDLYDHRSNNNINSGKNNSRGLASSPSYLDSAALNGRTTTSSSDTYGYEHSHLYHQQQSREQADYRRSKEEEEEDFSYLSPVSGKLPIIFFCF